MIQKNNQSNFKKIQPTFSTDKFNSPASRQAISSCFIQLHIEDKKQSTAFSSNNSEKFSFSVNADIREQNFNKSLTDIPRSLEEFIVLCITVLSFRKDSTTNA